MSGYGQIGQKRKLNSDNGGERRFPYQRREDTQSIEQHISDIALKRDDVTLDDIQRLLENVRREMSTRKNTIICTIVECFAKKRAKIPIYTTISGFLNQEDIYLGSDLVESLAIGLQDSLKEFNLASAQNYIIALCDLANVNVVQVSSVLDMIETFLGNAGEDNSSPLRSEWIYRSILNAIPFIGKFISGQELYKEKFEQIFEELVRCIRNRKSDYSKALKIWIKNDEFPQLENLDMLLEAILDLKSKKWTFECLNRPYLSIDTEFTSKGHKFVIESIPYIPLKSLRIPKIYFRAIEESECYDLKICSSKMPKFGDFDRYFISTMVEDVLNDPEDHRRSLYLLKFVVSPEKFNIPYIVTESLLVLLFNCDEVHEFTMKYSIALAELCRQKKEMFIPVVQQIIKNMIQSIQTMNIKYLHKFVHWFVLFVNNLNCEFKWGIFLECLDTNPDQYQLVFFHSVIKKLYSLVDVDKNIILNDLIKQIELPSQEPIFDFQDKPEKAIIQALAGSIKDKKSNEEIIKSIETEIEKSGINDVISPIIKTLLKGGSKTLTHTQTVIDKYFNIIQHFTDADPDYRPKCIEAVISFWKNNPVRTRQALDYFCQKNVLDNLGVVMWFLEKRISKSPLNLVAWEYVFDYLLLLNCRIKRIKKRISDLANSQNEKADAEFKLLAIEKRETKEERKNALQKISEKIVDLIIQNVSESQESAAKSTAFMCMLQRLQQILFENYDFFVKAQEFLSTLVDKCDKEEHVVEILKRFQSLCS